jgi:hypothetical protein
MFYAENTTAGTNSGWVADATSWISSSLTCGTSYTFRIKARNGDSVATSYTSDATTSTAACPVVIGSATPNSGAPIVIVPASPAAGQGAISPDSGGTISHRIGDGGSGGVTFPPGAAASTVSVSVVPQPIAQVSAAEPLPSGLGIAAGMVAQIYAYDGVFPVTQFNGAVTVRFTYTDASLGNIRESTLALYTWDPASRSWQRLADSRVDTAANVVTASTNHFSLFAVLGTGTSSAPAEAATRLIKAAGNPNVYVVTPTGFRRRIPSEAVFLSYGYRWADVAIISAAALAAYPETSLIQVAGNPRIYLASGATRQWIPDERTFLARRYTWNAVSLVSAAELAAYAEGPALTPTAQPAPAASGAITSFLSLGSSGAQVRILQTKLKAAGYFTPAVNGNYGAATRDAVVRFQRAKGIDPKGYVGPATRAAVNALP